MVKLARPTIIVAAADAGDLESTSHLVHLVELLTDRGYTVRVALIRGGEYVGKLRRLGHVIIADHARRRGVGGVLTLVGRRREAMGYRAWKGRRFMRWAAEHPWIICDPEASWFLRIAATRPPTIVVDLAGNTELVEVEPIDRPTLLDADLWMTDTEHRAADVRAAGVATPVHPIGVLRGSRPDTPLPSSDGTADPVVMSTPSGSWEAVSHTAEFVAQFRRCVADVPLVWLADPGEDEWLAQHDLAHLSEGAAERVTVRRRDDTSTLRPRLIVRTGYFPTDPDLVIAAAFEQIPTIGFEVGDLPSSASLAIGPFDVEALVERTVELLDDRARKECGAALVDAVRSHLDPRYQLGPLYDVLGVIGEATIGSDQAAQSASRP